MGVDVDQVTIDLAGEWILEIKAEVAKELEFEEDAILKIVLNAIHSLIHFDNLG